MKPRPNPPLFLPILIRADILREARTLDIPTGFAISISESVASVVESYLKNHPVVTELDIKSLIISELEKYHTDLAYIYRNRDTII